MRAHKGKFDRMYILLVDWGIAVQQVEEMLCDKLNGSEEMRPKVLNSDVYRPGPITRVMFLYVCVRFR